MGRAVGAQWDISPSRNPFSKPRSAFSASIASGGLPKHSANCLTGGTRPSYSQAGVGEPTMNIKPAAPTRGSAEIATGICAEPSSRAGSVRRTVESRTGGNDRLRARTFIARGGTRQVRTNISHLHGP
jgi:hypothetical protein